MTPGPEHLARETARGRRDDTPILAFTGVGIAVASVVSLMLLVAFLLYFLV
jgi:hypothetical protein